MEAFNIQRVTMRDDGHCAPASAVATLLACGLDVSQSDIVKFVANPEWGTTPRELHKILAIYLGNDHVILRENWCLDELRKLRQGADAVITLDITDELERVSSITGEKVAGVDGHWVIAAGFKTINREEYMKIIDSSREEIVVAQEGVILTNEENVYYVECGLLESIWHDTNEDGTENNHLAVVAFHPKEKTEKLKVYNNSVVL